jgi:sugar phosphate isomerase/epimerase
MQKLLVFQSLWAMERLSGDSHEPSLEENIARIAAAGFEGVSAHYTDRADVQRLNRAIRGTGLRIEGVCFPRSI